MLEFIVGRNEVFALFLQSWVLREESKEMRIALFYLGSAHFAMSRQLITDTPLRSYEELPP